MTLALGTVQFGVAYGVAGRGAAVPPEEARDILEAAWHAGVRVLDTAAAYGDIESRLAALTSGLPFEFVSKIPPFGGAREDEAVRHVTDAVERSRRRLGDRLTTLLFHRAEDLSGPFGDAAWRAAEAAAGSLRLGVSAYAPAEVVPLGRRYPIGVAQLPGNALDQRLALPEVTAGLEGVDVHVRSAFLQGLLLMPPQAASARVPAASAALAAFHAWCAARGMSALEAALGAVRALPLVSLVVVGVDRLEHLRDIVAAWQRSEPVAAPGLACADPDVIDPRRWSGAPAQSPGPSGVAP